MVYSTSREITAIVPAYNEEQGLPGVLRILTSYPHFSEVIVVNDGSSDATQRIAGAFPVRILSNETNIGKGASMERAVSACSTPYLFFCDADMRGLNHTLLDSIIKPVIAGETDMVIAMRNWRMFYLRSILSILPILGGQRALTRDLWRKVPVEYKDRFMIETALNFYARYWGRGYKYIVVPGLTQIIKEKKYGIVQGVTARLRMFAQILRCELRLQINDVPQTLRTGRIALTNLIAGVIGVVFGLVVVYAAFLGPYQFVRDIFERELLEDPSAPIIATILYITSHAGADIILIAGWCIVGLNALVILLNLNNLRYLLYPKAPREMIENG